MTDMEGVAGVLNYDDWVLPQGIFYFKGLRLLTEEVNAAVDGFFTEGAREIVVVDGHGAGGIDPEILDDRVFLDRGHGQIIWPWGLDRSFDALAFVGQHAKAGTPFSHITHTEWFDRVDCTINGISVGEYGKLALCAMELDIPTVLACGEDAFAHEAEALTPGVVTVSVKWGFHPDGLDDLNADEYRRAKLGARHLSPQKSRYSIKEGAKKALTKLKRDPSSFSYTPVKPPFARVVKFRDIGERSAFTTRHTHESSIIGLMNIPEVST